MGIQDISTLLKDKYPDFIDYLEDSIFVKVQAEKWLEVASLLKGDDKLKFDYLI